MFAYVYWCDSQMSIYNLIENGYQVPLIHDGNGPPSCDITRPQLELLMGSGFTPRQIAETLDASRSTVRWRRRPGSAVSNTYYIFVHAIKLL